VSAVAADDVSTMAGVEISQSVMRRLRSTEPAVAAEITRTVLRIPRENGTLIRLDVPNDPPGRSYFALAPEDTLAPVVIYRRDGDKFLVTALMDREKYSAYRQVEQQGLLDDPVVKLAAAGGLVAGFVRGSVSPYLAATRPEAARLPISLAPRPGLLAGREELLARLHAQLCAGDRPGPRVVALYGLAGAGKTSVAVEYAHRFLASAGIIWQFPAEDPTLLEAEFGRLAALLGAGGANLDPRDPVTAVHAVLADSPVPWLLVFDNAPDAASLARFLPPAGNGRVLITSQSALWPPDQGLQVPVLDVQTAAAFLVSRTGDDDADAAADLAAELGGLPLALAQAAAYIQAASLTLAGYLGLYRQRRADLLARGQVAGHPATVAATLGLALTRLEDDAPTAAGLMRLLACLAPDPVPLNLLLSNGIVSGFLDRRVTAALGPVLGDQLAVADAVAALRRHSLIAPAPAAMVLVHRVVQAVAVNQMPVDVAASWRRAAAVLLEAALPADVELPSTWPICAALLPHALAVFDPTSDGMFRIARYLGNSGSYRAARELFAQIAAAHEVSDSYGSEHPATMTARANLARWTGEAGDPAAARDLFAALLPIRDRVLGAEDPHSLATRANLASWTGEAGDPAAARDMYAALLPIRDRVLGAEHPHSLATRANLAFWTGEAGDPSVARDMYADLLPADERVIGAEHPDTLYARANLGTYTGMAGDAAAARDQFAALLPDDVRILGPEHPATLTARASLARWTGEAGDPSAARDQFAALLPDDVRILGPEHPVTLTARASLARWTGEAGDPAAAQDMYAALLPIRDRVLGPEHPATLTARASLARWTGEAGDPAAARDMYAALLPIRDRVLGPEHPDTLTARANLARWTGEAGDPSAARDFLAALLPEEVRVLGAEHPDTLTARANLAHWTKKALQRVT
jgi:hypothetical protein